MSTIDAILLGGGVGRRFSEGPREGQTSTPKQFVFLNGEPVWIHSLKALCRLEGLRQVVFTVPSDYLSLADKQLREFYPECPIPVKIIVGGERRQDSSRHALEALEQSSPPPTRVMIHDACRPYLSTSFLERIHEAGLDRSYGAWIPVVPVVETLKKVENHQVLETVDRSAVQRVQTPQIFEFSVIRSLVEKTRTLTDLNFTDDASLCEYYGIPVGTFDGDVRNIKLTYDFEMSALESMLSKKQTERVASKVPCESESASTYTA